MSRRRRPYDWATDVDDAWAPWAAALARVRRFFQDLADKDLHVGVGAEPVCVTCGQHWPCNHASQGR